MRITNNYNLPPAIYNALSFNYPPKPDRFSATDLIGPPLIRQLKIKHWEELVEDASERLWALLGQGVHAALDKHADPDSFAEEKLEIPYKGKVIVCKSDNWKDKKISDYKVTSVYSFLLGEKKDWSNQLNLYAWAWRQKGFETEEAEINAILRDWQKSKAITPDYPAVPFENVKIAIWTDEEQEKYIADRFLLHTTEAKECLPEEKWQTQTSYAIMKKGRKKAMRVLYSLPEAEGYCKQNGGSEVIERIGECKRCKNYCPVRGVCPYNIYKGHTEEETE